MYPISSCRRLPSLIQSRLSLRAGVNSPRHRPFYKVHGFHSASLRCRFWPSWVFNVTLACCRHNPAVSRGALTPALDGSSDVKAHFNEEEICGSVGFS